MPTPTNRDLSDIDTDFFDAQSKTEAIADLLFIFTSNKKNSVEELDEGTICALADAMRQGVQRMDRLFCELSESTQQEAAK